MPASSAIGNPLRQAFIKEVQRDGLPNPAARRSGYTSPRAGEKLMQIPEVVAEIKRQMRHRMRRLQMDGDEVWRALTRMATIVPADFMDADGNILDPKDWPRDVAACVGFSITPNGEIERDGKKAKQFSVNGFKITTKDKLAAVMALARINNLFSDEAKDFGRGLGQGLTDGLADIIQRAQQDGGGVSELIASPVPIREALPEPDKSVVAEQKPEGSPVLASGLVRRVAPPTEKQTRG